MSDSGGLGNKNQPESDIIGFELARSFFVSGLPRLSPLLRRHHVVVDGRAAPREPAADAEQRDVVGGTRGAADERRPRARRSRDGVLTARRGAGAPHGAAGRSDADADV